MFSIYRSQTRRAEILNSEEGCRSLTRELEVVEEREAVLKARNARYAEGQRSPAGQRLAKGHGARGGILVLPWARPLHEAR